MNFLVAVFQLLLERSRRRLRLGLGLRNCVYFVALVHLCIVAVSGQARKGEVTPFLPLNEQAYREDNARTFDEPTRRAPDIYYRWNAIRYCICSPTTRGWPSPELPLAKEYIKRLGVVHAHDRHHLLRPSVERLAEYAAINISREFGVEGFINLDAYLRRQIPRVMCAYDNETQRNIAPFYPKDTDDVEGVKVVTLKLCNLIGNTASTQKAVDAFVGKEEPEAIPFPTLEPTATPEIKEEL